MKFIERIGTKYAASKSLLYKNNMNFIRSSALTQ
jgi:hypothetical protein